MSDLRNRFNWLWRRANTEADADARVAIAGNGDGAEREYTPISAEPLDLGEAERDGKLVRLRRHVPSNRTAFQRWYASPEIAKLLRHDQRPLNEIQSRGYFDTIILPASARGTCWAIHEAATDRLIGTSALTDFEGVSHRAAHFRIVIGEPDCWGRGYGTEATSLVMAEGFERHGLNEVKLEVFRHNTRAFRAYERVGFLQTGEHIEWVGRDRFELQVIEMSLYREEFYDRHPRDNAESDASSRDFD